MPKDFQITTDNTCDLPREFYINNNISVCPIGFSIDGESFDGVKENMPSELFYKKMRDGHMPITAQANPTQIIEVFKPILEQGKDILHISFSSGLSGTYNNALLAKNELESQFPDSKIIVIDSLAASLGEGMICFTAVELKNKGLSIDEVANEIERSKLNACHLFTVSDLNHLYRGGRVSKTAAFLGTLIHIKPVLFVDNDGHLIPSVKVKGRKKSIETLADKMLELISGYECHNDIENSKIFISHGDCLEDALYLKSLISQKTGMKDFIINPIGATIGAHSGPDTIALFFYGKSRLI